MVNDNTPAAPPTSSASGCPVLASGNGEGDSISSSSKSGIWNRWFSRSSNSTEQRVSNNVQPSVANSISECPVKGSRKSLPASIEEAAKHSQSPAPGQKIPLSTQRVISSIPRGDDEEDASTENKSIPAHQPVNSQRWQYPSEQQFYNAMLKKGYRPPVQSIPSVLQIHNAVNERSWLQVCKWEKEIHNNVEPRLVKFVGRPKDISPKAWLNSRIFMTQEPFDRHDWFIEDKDGGEPRRYVIDFYEGKEKTGDLAPSLSSATGKDGKIGGSSGSSMPVMKPPSMYIDVRPALDNPSAAVDRMAMVVRETLPGLTGVWDSFKASSSSKSPLSVAEMEGAKKNKDETNAKK